MRKSNLLAELTDVLSDSVSQDLCLLSVGIDNNPWGQYQPCSIHSKANKFVANELSPKHFRVPLVQKLNKIFRLMWMYEPSAAMGRIAYRVGFVTHRF